MSSSNALASHGWWLASRASGLVALGLITISVIVGLMMSSKMMRKPGLSRFLMALHEQTALAGLIGIGVHGVTLLGDSWLKASVSDILIPFTSNYRPLYTGLGVVAGYLSILLGLTFYLRNRIGAKRWRSLHRFTLVAYLLAVVHTLGAGTDATTLWLRVSLLGSFVPVLFLFIVRVLPKARAEKPSSGTSSLGTGVSRSVTKVKTS